MGVRAEGEGGEGWRWTVVYMCFLLSPSTK